MPRSFAGVSRQGRCGGRVGRGLGRLIGIHPASFENVRFSGPMFALASAQGGYTPSYVERAVHSLSSALGLSSCSKTRFDLLKFAALSSERSSSSPSSSLDREASKYLSLGKWKRQVNPPRFDLEKRERFCSLQLARTSISRPRTPSVCPPFLPRRPPRSTRRCRSVSRPAASRPHSSRSSSYRSYSSTPSGTRSSKSGALYATNEAMSYRRRKRS